MLAGVAHELNNPLTAILGVTELLRDSEGVQDNTKRQLELTHRQPARSAHCPELASIFPPAAPKKAAGR